MPKVPMKTIEFIWSESNSIPDKTVVTTWQAAQALISAALQEYDMHEMMGYFKTKFKITWEDEETYEGRLDISPREDKNLGLHVIEFARFYGGMLADNEIPSHLTPATYRGLVAHQSEETIAAYKELLDKYELVVDVWTPRPGDYDYCSQLTLELGV